MVDRLGVFGDGLTLLGPGDNLIPAVRLSKPVAVTQRLLDGGAGKLTASKMLTHSATLYLASVLIWGSTWYAIKFQLGVVAAEVSLVYRFALAAVILLLFCLLSGRDLKYSPRQHGFCACFPAIT
jgi:hypothetical protein